MRKRIKKTKLLLELLKDSKRSDRDLAKVLGVSQPTVTRMRQILVKEGWIKEFTVIPDFVKMGYELMAITCAKTKMRRELYEMARKSHHKTIMKTPNIIFASGVQGMGKDKIMISLHKTYGDFYSFLQEFLLEWGENIEEYDTLLVSLKANHLKPFSLAYLAEQEET